MNWGSLFQILGSIGAAGGVYTASGDWHAALITLAGMLAKDFTPSDSLLTPAPAAPPAKPAA